MTETHPSFCRMCHSACPILVEVEDGVAVKVGGRSEPARSTTGTRASRAGRCPRCTTHPDRLLHSLARQPDGSFAPIASSSAMDEIAASLHAVVADHGPLAVALYSGTFGLANTLTAPLTNAFREAIGNPRGWVATSIDQPGKTIAQGLMGVWMALHQGPATADVCLDHRLEPARSRSRPGCRRPTRGSGCTTRSDAGSSSSSIDPRRHETASQADIFLQPQAGGGHRHRGAG